MKREALNKAGVGYIEVFPSDTAEEIELLIQKRLGWKPAFAEIYLETHE